MEFALEDGRLWIYTPEGERLRTHEEAEQDRQDAQARAAVELAISISRKQADVRFV